jgi:hypothetical protein
MEVIIFIIGMGGAMFGILAWGFFALPREKWQMAAVLPVKKLDRGQWQGLNLTWYGILSANAYTLGVVMAVMLAGAAGVPLSALVLLTLLLLGITVPASKIVARLVEKKKGTLTVGGAVFTGVVAAPWLIVLVNQNLGRAAGFSMPVMAVMASLSIGYTFGEGLGRLACLSFGCCYGKPLNQCPPWMQRLFSHFHVVFTGSTKKAAYASGLEGEKMLPVQIVTAALYTVSGLAGTWLFLSGMPGAALVETLLVTQVWRVVSECFRADYRGGRKFSAYQIMALATIAYAGIMGLVFPAPEVPARLLTGLAALWHPGMILFFQGIWLAAFLHAGRSSVTGSRVFFHVVRDRI